MRYLIVLLLAGCATQSQVLSYGDALLITAGDAGGTTASSTLYSSVVREANAYCSKRGKKMVVKDSATSGTRFTGTNAKLVFACQ